MTDKRTLILEDQRLLAHPDEHRRYMAFRRQFAAELYVQLLGQPYTPLMSALLNLANDDQPVRRFPTAPRMVDSSDF